MEPSTASTISPFWRHLWHLGMIFIQGLLAFGVHVLLYPVLAISLDFSISAARCVGRSGDFGLVGSSSVGYPSVGCSSVGAEDPRSFFQGGHPMGIPSRVHLRDSLSEMVLSISSSERFVALETAADAAPGG